MEGPFTDGIFYISREEEEKAEARLQGRSARLAALDQINYDILDGESAAFVEDTRRKISDWNANENVRSLWHSFVLASLVDHFEQKKHFLNISGPEKMSSASRTLSNYQKRLVHQLVRSEFPNLVSIGKSTFVQIIEYDKEREQNVLGHRMTQLRERIYSQMGFRWLVEAMIGGDVSKLSPPSLVGSPPRGGGNALERCEELRARLKAKRLILVGHNLFTDLVNFYNCFFGSLPATVEEFLSAVHELFPIIIDTKYLATYDCGSELPSSMLTEIDEKLTSRRMPFISE